MEAFSDMKAPAFVFDYAQMMQLVSEMAHNTPATIEADRRVRDYYTQADAQLLWIDRAGVDSRADSLLNHLLQVGDVGFS